MSVMRTTYMRITAGLCTAEKEPLSAWAVM
jgi:hypothetical protein